MIAIAVIDSRSPGGDARWTHVFASSESLSVRAFDRLAEALSQFVSRGAFFTVSLVALLIWMPTILLFSSVDTWQLVINTLTSVLAFLLIALLQNSERRYDESTTRSTPWRPG